MASSLLNPFAILVLIHFLLPCALSLPLCTDLRAPVSLKSPLTFCGYSGSSCCTASDDSAIKRQFDSMNISDSSCAAIVQSLLCTKCDPFSAEIFTSANIRTVPVLCNSSTALSSSKQSKAASNDFCSQVWDTCKDIPIKNSLFTPSSQAQPSSLSKLSDLWQSDKDFCKAFGGSSDDSSVCYDGKSAAFNTTQASPIPKGLCLERIGNGSFLNMAAHPDGSNRVFLTSQAGKIWLATIPEGGSGGSLVIDDSRPFLDLTDEVHYDNEFGLLGIAFHPNFTSNGRFFVSFNCDKEQSTSCSGRCSCNSDVDCDPAKLSPDSGSRPCQYQSVISEFTANSTLSTPSTATSANPMEVRRIFTMGLPFTSHHGGQILFGPADGYLYFMMGDGGGQGDPMNFAQNRKSLLGKIMRLDVNNMPSSKEVSNLGLWGNYSIPKDNPSATDSTFQPEIWALGLRNPWRCTFDSQRPSYFFCADVGQDSYEEVNLVSKGGNYGWRIYEGPELFHSTSSPGVNTTSSSINAIFPVMGYPHSSVNKVVGSASVTGGYVYRSSTDPCMFGRYLYADLYGANMWAGTENPEGSGNFTSASLPFKCAKDSAIPCDTVAGESLPSLGYIYSFGQDNNKDMYILASKGLYRVVRPSRCSYICPKENTTDTGDTPSNTPSAGHMENSPGKPIFLSAVLLTAAAFFF